jgi:hypothetical protein
MAAHITPNRHRISAVNRGMNKVCVEWYTLGMICPSSKPPKRALAYVLARANASIAPLNHFDTSVPKNINKF